MSLTFNLILALFLLAPGLGIFAGVYTGGHRPFRPAAAEPGSIHALALVALGSLFCHALCAWFFVWMAHHCLEHACFRVAFDPNPYEIILDLREGLARSGGSEAMRSPAATSINADSLAWLFTSLLAIGCFGFVFGLASVSAVGRIGFLRQALYGWVDELLRQATTKAHVFTAYVLTDTEADGKLLGYEGSLVDLRQSPTGEIKVVVLKDAEPFVVDLKEGSGLRVKGPGPKTTIALLTIEGAHITNVAFRPYLDPRRLSASEYERMVAAGDLDVTPEEDEEAQEGEGSEEPETHEAGEPRADPAPPKVTPEPARPETPRKAKPRARKSAPDPDPAPGS